MKKPLLLISFLVCLFAVTSQAQNYQSAIGARLGSPLSVTYKTFLNESSALEAYGGFRSFSGYSWFSVAGAYQIHKPLTSEIDGLNYYFGGGAAAFFWSYDLGFDGGASTSFGLQGYLGLDYTFADSPINITVDWVPTIFLNGFGSGFGAGYGSLGVRYVLSR
ncbi:MAG: hypothetical protein AAF960_26930 [Bacteroidota bacterium]